MRDTFLAANVLVPALKQDAPLEPSLFQKIQDERMLEIRGIQAGQTRAGQMVLKPLGVLHVMFTLLGTAMKLMPGKFGGPPPPPPQPQFLTPVGRA